jgi:hypothetical protein
VVLFVAGFGIVLGFVTAASSVLSLSMLLRGRARIIAKTLQTAKALRLTGPTRAARGHRCAWSKSTRGTKSAPSAAVLTLRFLRDKMSCNARMGVRP